MRRKLTTTGNSVALVLTKDLRDHLGVTDFVEVTLTTDSIVIKKPMSVHEASEYSRGKYKDAYEKLAE